MRPKTLVWLTTNPVTTWWIRNVASRIDPWLYRRTNGRLFSMGPPSAPMVTITTLGRKTGRPRPVHLACVEAGGEKLVVASAMGQERHPGWSYNLEAHPVVEVQLPGERTTARAELLSEAERELVWPEIHRSIPMMAVYEKRTERAIKVFRLRGVDGRGEPAADR